MKCPIHTNVEMAEIGRMTLDGPIELACEFCMNDLEPECIHAHAGNCAGEVGVITSDHGTVMAMCDAHELRYYQRQDEIRANYR